MPVKRKLRRVVLAIISQLIGAIVILFPLVLLAQFADSIALLLEGPSPNKLSRTDILPTINLLLLGVAAWNTARIYAYILSFPDALSLMDVITRKVFAEPRRCNKCRQSVNDASLLHAGRCGTCWMA